MLAGRNLQTFCTALLQWCAFWIQFEHFFSDRFLELHHEMVQPQVSWWKNRSSSHQAQRFVDVFVGNGEILAQDILALCHTRYPQIPSPMLTVVSNDDNWAMRNKGVDLSLFHVSVHMKVLRLQETTSLKMLNNVESTKTLLKEWDQHQRTCDANALWIDLGCTTEYYTRGVCSTVRFCPGRKGWQFRQRFTGPNFVGEDENE